MLSKDIKKVFEIWAENNPEPKTELVYSNEYELLVAVVLSAQATDISVNKATDTLFKEANNPEAMLILGQDRLKEHIKSIGLYHSKAKHVMALSQLLIDQYHSKIPQTREELMSLPGVGRKTANVVLNVLFGLPTIAVDTHIFRVSNRTGMAPGKTPEKVEALLEKRVPVMYRVLAHYWMILHGRYVCLARKPRCHECEIYQYCDYVK